MKKVMQRSPPIGNCRIHSEIVAPSATLHENGVDKQPSPWAALYHDGLHTQCTSAPIYHGKESNFTYIYNKYTSSRWLYSGKSCKLSSESINLMLSSFFLRSDLCWTISNYRYIILKSIDVHKIATYMILKLWAVKAFITFKSSLKLDYIFCHLYILNVSHFKVLYGI